VPEEGWEWERVGALVRVEEGWGGLAALF